MIMGKLFLVDLLVYLRQSRIRWKTIFGDMYSSRCHCYGKSAHCTRGIYYLRTILLRAKRLRIDVPSASSCASRLAELRRRGLGAGVPAAGPLRGRHQERAAHGRGLPLPQRLHAHHQGKYNAPCMNHKFQLDESRIASRGSRSCCRSCSTSTAASSRTARATTSRATSWRRGARSSSSPSTTGKRARTIKKRIRDHRS